MEVNKTTTEQARFEMDADEFEAFVQSLDSRRDGWEGRDR